MDLETNDTTGATMKIMHLPAPLHTRLKTCASHLEISLRDALAIAVKEWVLGIESTYSAELSARAREIARAEREEREEEEGQRRVTGAASEDLRERKRQVIRGMFGRLKDELKRPAYIRGGIGHELTPPATPEEYRKFAIDKRDIA